MTLNKAYERLKRHCLKLVGCKGCKFASEYGCVLRATIPADWELPSEKKEVR